MSNATQGIRARIVQSRTPTIYNVSSPGTANTEFSQALSDNTKSLIIRSRDRAKIQLAFNSGESGTDFISIPKGASLELNNLDFISKTLYMQVDQASVTVEILELS